MGKCVRAFHVTCAQLVCIEVDFEEDGTLKALCFAHDPVYKQRKKAEADYKLAKQAQTDFQPGAMVIVRQNGTTFEGLVLKCQVEKRGCMVQYENHEEAELIAWANLKLKPIDVVKPKKTPVYNDNKPRKNPDFQSILTEMLQTSDENIPPMISSK